MIVVIRVEPMEVEQTGVSSVMQIDASPTEDDGLMVAYSQEIWVYRRPLLVLIETTHVQLVFAQIIAVEAAAVVTTVEGLDLVGSSAAAAAAACVDPAEPAEISTVAHEPLASAVV